MNPDTTDAARLRSLVHNSFDLTTISNVDGKLLYVSPSIERILGYSPEEVLGQDILSFVHPDDAQRVSAAFVHAVNTPGILDPTVVRVGHRDGSWRVIEAAANNLVDDPAVRGIVHNMHDITARYEAEAAVRRSEQQLRAYLDQANDLIWTIDPQGRISSVNDKVCETLGYAAAELVPLQVNSQASHVAGASSPLPPGGRGARGEGAAVRRDGISWIKLEGH
jgi:PAS domain S-box-containing protein